MTTNLFTGRLRNTYSRLSPFAWVAETRARRRVRIQLPSLPPRPLSAGDRAFLAALRAAELAAWQASGGDALSARSARLAGTESVSAAA